MATLLRAHPQRFSLRHPFPFSLGLGAALLASQSLLRPQIRLCDSNPSRSNALSDSLQSYSRDAKVPVIKDGRPNRGALRQISAGSILGLIGGLAVSTFSKPLALIIGLLVFGAQYLASRGVNVIPRERIQQYVKGIDVRSAIEDNVAFKLSFGATFGLASFASF